MRVIWRYSLQKVPASCFASLGLWIGLGLHGIGLESLKIGPYSRIDSGSLQLVLALVLNAVALTWLEFIGIRGKCIGARQSFEIVSAISTRNIKSKFLLWSALSMGLALSAGVLRFQDQEASFIVPAESATAASTTSAAAPSNLRIEALEGVLALDSQTTARKNRMLTIKVQAAEYVGPAVRIRSDWKRPLFFQVLFSGAGARLCAGSLIRVESFRTGEFLWVDASKLKWKGWASGPAKFRAIVTGRFADSISVTAGKAGPLAQALLLGVKDELDSEFKELFQAAGCAHLLALSGQHLSIICALVSLIGRRIIKKEKMVRKISLVFAWFFVWLAGPGPSLLRSVFMLSCAEIARELDRPQSGFALLSLASILLALFSPRSINSLSSIYSFSAMAGLMAFSGRFLTILRHWMPDLLAKAFSASLAAVCGTAPVSLLTFGTFIPAGIFAATAAAPIMLVFMWIALASALLAIPLPVIGRITAPLLEVLHSVLAWILASGAAFPIFEAGLAPIGRILASLLIVSLIALIYAIPWASWRKSRQKTEEFYRRASFVDIKKMLIRLDPPE
jgi:ComEC/Rec2-related protein